MEIYFSPLNPWEQLSPPAEMWVVQGTSRLGKWELLQFIIIGFLTCCFIHS